MRFFLTVLVFVSLTNLYGQSPVFLVVDFSDGVTIDGRVPEIGELIDNTSKKILIPQKGYALVIVQGGEPYHLTSSMSVDRLVEKGSPGRVNRFRLTGSAIACPPEMYLIGPPHNSLADFIGDSIFVAIQSNYVKLQSTFIFEYRDMFDKVVFSDSTNLNWSVHDLNFSQEEALIFSVRNGKYQSGYHLIKRVSNERKEQLKSKISRITESRQSEILKLALFQFHNLYYDQVFLLFKLTSGRHRPENEILEAYLNRLKEKYHFELFDFHK